MRKIFHLIIAILCLITTLVYAAIGDMPAEIFGALLTIIFLHFVKWEDEKDG